MEIIQACQRENITRVSLLPKLPYPPLSENNESERESTATAHISKQTAGNPRGCLGAEQSVVRGGEGSEHAPALPDAGGQPRQGQGYRSQRTAPGREHDATV